MDTFMQIKDLASKLSAKCFNNEQVILITGYDMTDGKMFSYTSGNFFSVIGLLSEYIERLGKDNPIRLSKFELLDMIRTSYDEGDEYDKTT